MPALFSGFSPTLRGKSGGSWWLGMALGELGAGRASSASPGCMNPTAVLCLPQPWLWDVVLKAKIAVLMEGFPSCAQQCEAGGLAAPSLEAVLCVLMVPLFRCLCQLAGALTSVSQVCIPPIT